MVNNSWIIVTLYSSEFLNKIQNAWKTDMEGGEKGGAIINTRKKNVTKKYVKLIKITY